MTEKSYGSWTKAVGCGTLETKKRAYFAKKKIKSRKCY